MQPMTTFEATYCTRGGALRDPGELWVWVCMRDPLTGAGLKCRGAVEVHLKKWLFLTAPAHNLYKHAYKPALVSRYSTYCS